MLKPIFMLLGCPLNFGSDHPKAKVSVDVGVTGVPRGIYYSSYYLDVALAGTTPQLYSTSPHRFYDMVVNHYFVLCG
jgi:hypothetical protein